MRLLVYALIATLAGCSGLPTVNRADEEWLLATARTGGEDADVPIPAEASLLALTPEMKRFAEAAVAAQSSDSEKVRALLRAIIDPAQLGLEFDEGVTYNAAQAFKHARANCLGFTAMFVAMARHIGLEAHFNEVDVPPIWNIHDLNTLVQYKHMNALIGVTRHRWQVVDVYPEEYDVSYPQRKISDARAVAQYYNNLAMDLLREDRLSAAQQHLVAAIALAPEVSYFWGNLGATHRRAGQHQAAEVAFVKALHVGPKDHAAASNAARLFAQTGRYEIARLLERRAARSQRQNPYYRYRQAFDALTAERYSLARTHALAAIHLYGKEHRFHFLLGTVYHRLGERELARLSFLRAIELAGSEQAAKYSHKMQVLMSAAL